MNQNPERLNQLLLRTMLLEGVSGENVFKAVRKFKKDSDEQEAIGTIRKEIVKHSKHLMKDESIAKFIEELSNQIQPE